MNPLNENLFSTRRTMGTLAIAVIAALPGLAGAHSTSDGEEGHRHHSESRESDEDEPGLSEQTRDTALSVAAFPMRVLSTIVTGGETTNQRARGAKRKEASPDADSDSRGRGVMDRFEEKMGPSDSGRARGRGAKSQDDYENLVNAATDTIKLLVTLPFKALSYAASVRAENGAAADEGPVAHAAGGKRTRNDDDYDSDAPRPRRSGNALSKTSDHLGGAVGGVVDETGDVTYTVIKGVWNAAKATIGTIANLGAGTVEQGAQKAGKRMREDDYAREERDDRDDDRDADRRDR